jgi:hypothetical protein
MEWGTPEKQKGCPRLAKQGNPGEIKARVEPQAPHTAGIS